jgi:alkanesulfonate monooxygenase SsuD/methylene tetrahydromethanopterin reductase-like flavin-dependent oxidoreductase (luciferase family)
MEVPRMRIGANLGPTGDWPAMLAAAQTADTIGFDALGFLDHYHTDKLEWPYLCGWSAYGALAMATSRIHLVPLVIDRLNYLPGVLAKETSTLSILSKGRFELGIGAGDYFQEARAWGLPIPDTSARISGLKETVTVLRQIWRGEQVTFEGEHLHLTNAASTPIPPTPPRVVIGAGDSRRLISGAVEYADEVNVYADDDAIRFARQAIEAAQRRVSLSVYVWDWFEDIKEKMIAWEQLGVERTFITFWHPFDKLALMADLL